LEVVVVAGVSRRAFLGGATGGAAFIALGNFGALQWLEQLVEPTTAGADPVLLPVKLYGRSLALSGRFVPGEPGKLPSSEPLTMVDIDAEFPAGMMMGWGGATSDGRVFVGVVPQSGTVASNGIRQSVAVYDLLASTPALTIKDLDTDHVPLGADDNQETKRVHNLVRAGFYDPYKPDPHFGGADISDVCVIPADPAHGIPELVVLNSVTPYGSWRIKRGTFPNNPELNKGHGVFRTFVAFTKPEGATDWVYHPAKSKTADQLYSQYAADTSVAVADKVFKEQKVFSDNESHRGALGVTEMDRFPNNHVVASQYYPSSGAGAGVIVMDFDPATGADAKVVASYKFPDFYDRNGKLPETVGFAGAKGARPVGWACRSVMVEPTSPEDTDLSDLRFFVLPDVTPAPARRITHVSRDGNKVTFRTVWIDNGTLKNTSDDLHSYGVGQFPEISNLPATTTEGVNLSVYNTIDNQSALAPITEVFDDPGKTYSDFSIFVPGTPSTFTLVPVPIAAIVPPNPQVYATSRLRQGAPVIEMRYNALAIPPTITPVSAPCHLDENQAAIGTVVFDGDGNMCMNPVGTTAFFGGALSVWRKIDGQRTLVRKAPAPGLVVAGGAVTGQVDEAAFARSWGTVVHPDAAFGATAGPGSMEGGMVFDKDKRTAYWTCADLLKRVQLAENFAVEPLERFVDGGFELGTAAFTPASATSRAANCGRAPNMPYAEGFSLKVVVEASGTAMMVTSKQRFAVVPGRSYTVSAWLHASVPGVTPQGSIGLKLFDRDNTESLATPLGSQAGLGSGWTLVTAKIEVPASVPSSTKVPALAQVVVQVDGMAATQAFYVDDVSFLDENRAVNPGFEINKTLNLDAAFNKWWTAFGNNAALARVAITDSNGNPAGFAMKLTSVNGVAPTMPNAMSNDLLPVLAGQSYNLAGSFRAATGFKGRASIGVKWVTSATPPVTVGTEYGPAVTIDDSRWFDVRAFLGAPTHNLTTTDPNGAAFAQIIVKCEQMGANGSFLVDDLAFEAAPGTNLPSIDLAISKLPRGGAHQTKLDDVVPRWLGESGPTANGGFTTMTRPVIAGRTLFVPVTQYGPTDRIIDPGFEAGIGRFTSAGAAAAWGNTFKTGKRSLQITPDVGSTAAALTYAAEDLVVRPGQGTSIKAWVKVPSGSPTVQLGFLWFLADNTAAGELLCDPIALTHPNEWQQVTATVATPDVANQPPIAYGRFTLRFAGLPSAPSFIDSVSVLNATGPAVPPAVLDQYLYEIALPS
jgi:hypothetical protein